VLNNSPQVSSETRERVLEAIRILDYRPNLLARQLSRGRRVHSIGIISPFVNDYSFSARLAGVQTALAESAYTYDLVFYAVSSPERFHQRLLAVAEHGPVEGLLIMAINLAPEQRALLWDAGLLFVGIGDHPMTDWPLVGGDNVCGGALAARYLIGLGHTRIAYIGDTFTAPYGFSTSEARYQGFTEALDAAGVGLPQDYVRLGTHGREAAHSMAADLFALTAPPTAIFCMSDVQALGCLAAARDAGLRVPEDVSILGFDDVELSRLVGLSTVRQHLEQGGYLATRYLLSLLDAGAALETVPALPPFEVVERQTTRRL
jgi:LacI family transcriptional regulator